VKVVAIQVVIFLIGLAVIELVLRTFAPLPVPGGIYLDRNGQMVRPALDELTLNPNLDITHKGSEFAARIRTNSLGNRIIDNESRTPDVLWLGDSFTFGHGVSDEDVFSYIVCTRSHIVCQNMGHSGSNTFQQVAILANAMAKDNVRPKSVVLVMLTACWIEQAGNDLGDNLIYAREHPQLDASDVQAARRPKPNTVDTQAPPDEPGLLKRLQARVGNYEIVKRGMPILSVWIKRSTYRCSDPGQIRPALEVTKKALRKLEDLARTSGFSVTLVEIHPLQELDGLYRETERLVGGIVPESFTRIPTGEHFSKEHYYPYDGHFNAAGHARLAEVLARALKPQFARPSPDR
jgi:hypothetical protein